MKNDKQALHALNQESATSLGSRPTKFQGPTKQTLVGRVRGPEISDQRALGPGPQVVYPCFKPSIVLVSFGTMWISKKEINFCPKSESRFIKGYKLRIRVHLCFCFRKLR